MEMIMNTNEYGFVLGKMYYNGGWYQQNKKVGINLIEKSFQDGNKKAEQFLDNIEKKYTFKINKKEVIVNSEFGEIKLRDMDKISLTCTGFSKGRLPMEEVLRNIIKRRQRE